MQTGNPFDTIMHRLDQIQATLIVISANNPPQAKKPELPDPDRILNLPEAAKILRKPVATVRNYIHTRRLPATLVGKSYLIKHGDLMRWFEQVQEENRSETISDATARMLENRRRYRKD